MTKLCEFALDKSIGYNINVVCTKNGEFCSMIRYCSVEQKPVMGNNYIKYGCPIKKQYGDNMGRKRKEKENKVINEVLPVNIGSSTLAYDMVVGKVNFTKNNKTSIQYPLNGHFYNITVDGTYSGTVTIEYSGVLTNKTIHSIIQN